MKHGLGYEQLNGMHVEEIEFWMESINDYIEQQNEEYETASS
jgi:hypothetical protein